MDTPAEPYNDSRSPVFVSTMTSDQFETYHSFVHVEDGLRLHTHDHYEINCVLDGVGEFYIDGHLLTLHAGDILLVNPDVIHNIVRQKSERYERVYLHINPRFLQSVSTRHTDLTSCFHTSSGVIINRLITMPLAQLRTSLLPLLRPPSSHFGDDIHYATHFLNFMIQLNEHVFADTEGTVFTQTRLPYSSLVNTALRYIDEHLADELTLDIIALHCAANKYYLSRIFKKEMDMTIGRFIQYRRLQHSKRLLAEVGSPKLIYKRCGFKSYTHFLRCFQQEFGMTTSAYTAWTHTPHTQH